ncbi:MAG: hypothetical protein JWQ07_545 [Ramlibacter sp.]|nr:hypothetical protein [Ramlibacter sp.]
MSRVAKPLIVVFLLALAGCSGMPRPPNTQSPCYASEASYECQIERYKNVNAD